MRVINILGHQVDKDLLGVYFMCDYSKCKGGCCYCNTGEPLEGGELTEEEAKEINHKRMEISQEVSRSYRSRCSTVPTYTIEGTYYTGLSPQGACVLLNMEKGGCALKECLNKGITSFGIPTHCALYPLVTEDTEGNVVLTIGDVFPDLCKDGYIKGKENRVKLYDFCKEAIIRYYGEEFYNELKRIGDVSTNY